MPEQIPGSLVKRGVMVALFGFWRRLRIRNKIVLPIMAIALLMALTVTPITAAVFSARTNERAMEQITGVANLFKVIVSQRESDLLALGRALPESTELQEAWINGDGVSVAGLLASYRAHFALDAVLLLDEQGRRQVGLGDPFHPSMDLAAVPTIFRALSGTEGAGILDTGVHLCLCIAVPMPLGSEDVVGAILIGNLLDDQYVGKLKQSSGVDILLRREGQIRASTLPVPMTRALAGTPSFREGFRWVTVGKGAVQDSARVLGLPYRVSHSALETPAGNLVEYSMLLPMAGADQAARETVVLLLVVGGTGTLVLMLVGFLIARYVSGRLDELVQAARRLAGGDLSQRIQASSQDEVGELSKAFNQMAQSLEARDHMVRSQQGELESHNAALSAMVQEMHHRIKNNLQTVADLLSLEMSQMGPDLRDGLGSSIARVKSIATVHELLSVDDTAYTDVRQLSERLLKMAIQTAVPPGKRITGSVTGPPLRLPSKQATSLALVLNELISNALEHAFVGRTHGSLSIVLVDDSPRGVITVCDDGVGLPRSFTLEEVDTLGLQIVKTLVSKELRGSLTLESICGTAAVIRFSGWE